MKKEELRSEWLTAIDNRTFLIEKHDPNSLENTSDRYKTVVTHEVSASLKDFIKSDDYSVQQYYDRNFNSNYFEIVPTSGSFTVTGGEVLPFNDFTGSHCDRLVVVSGSSVGWHVYAEDSNEIRNKVINGRLEFSGSL